MPPTLTHEANKWHEGLKQKVRTLNSANHRSRCDLGTLPHVGQGSGNFLINIFVISNTTSYGKKLQVRNTVTNLCSQQTYLYVCSGSEYTKVTMYNHLLFTIWPNKHLVGRAPMA